jgi:hypothetical protein
LRSADFESLKNTVGPAPDGVGLAALQDHVVAKDGADERKWLGNRSRCRLTRRGLRACASTGRKQHRGRKSCAINVVGMDVELMTANLLLWMCGVLALEVAGVLGVTASVVLRVLWVSAERAAAAWECLTGGDNGIGRRPLLDPVDDGGSMSK